MSKKLKKERTRILIALILYAAVVLGEHLLGDRLPASIHENHWLMAIPYLVPYILIGWDVVRKAFLGIVHGQMLDESFLMTLATVGAFATGENPEACAVMLFYQIGEWFQSYAVDRSRGSIKDLMEIVPESAERLLPDGSLEEIEPDDVAVGDILLVRAGEKIPVDGTVLEGDGRVNTAALTGESVPRSVHAGDEVISGCVNEETLLKIRADKQYEDSTVVRILELVEEASERKSHLESFITRFARIYTPIVVFGAVALAVIPSLLTHDAATWIYRACTFLVISCPCALVISVPLAFFGGIGAASRAGVLVKGSNYLELMGRLRDVVSDKTGTLTRGVFTVNRILPAAGVTEEDVLRTAALAEGMSTHPIAASIREACTARGLQPQAALAKAGSGGCADGADALPAVVRDVTSLSGRGLLAVVQTAPAAGKAAAAGETALQAGLAAAAGETAPPARSETTAAETVLLVGSAALLRERGIDFETAEDPASTIVYVAADSRFLGAILISDQVKPEAQRAIADMKKEGVERFIMLSGDRRQAAEAVGSRLGVDQVRAELLPGDKVAAVEELLREEEHSRGRGYLAFIGDGINDAPVLMRADVGIAMGSLGSDAAIEAADVVIMDDDLERIPLVMRIARRTIAIARQNIVFALVIKVLILILATVGIATMWAAVFADVGVAVLCILNSMRLLARQK
ncbi:MAG: heavy metal translocating P-type ATPase [Anaerovoracaceae bacterium]|jgi:Cd2+/Zn2+-exporting ATPase